MLRLFSAIPLSQFVGGMIETTLIFGGGLYLLLLWPRIIRRRVDAGTLTEAEAQEKLRKPSPKLGYLLLFAAAGQLIIQLMQWFS
jgi:hypothetical protein